MAENGKTKERQGIALQIFSDWTGSTSDRGIGIEGTIVVDEKDANGKLIDFEEVVLEVQEAVADGTVVTYNPNNRSIKMKQNYRFDVNLPIPTTDEDAKELYGITLVELVEAGVSKLSYDRDTGIGNTITSALARGVEFGTIDDISEYEKTFEDELKTPKERVASVAKENKKKASLLDALMDKYGVDSPADLVALIEASKED